MSLPSTSDHRAPAPSLELHRVWKKFHRGEVHDSLRDLIPAMTRRLLGRAPPGDELEEGDFWALRDVSFRVGPGEALGIIGPNGAGKSTVLKILTRILRPTRGWCEVEGRVGALIEIAAGFHPDLTGRENIFLQGAIIGMPSAYIAKRFDDIVEFSGIGPFVDTPVKRYSSGMNARLGFAIAAHLDPEVLVIDEVLAVGDLAFQQRCYDRLGEFRRSGIPIAFVSHNMQAIASVCDRVLLLRPGQEPLMGSVPEMLAAYTASGSAAVEDPRIESCWASLRDAATDQPVTGPIAPHRELQLRLKIKASEPLPRCHLALVVTRSDGTRMYDAVCHSDREMVDLEPGGEAQFDVRFDAHLLRGTYIVSAVLLDREQRWPNLRLGNLGSFVVDERDSWAGYAALGASASYSVTAQSPS